MSPGASAAAYALARMARVDPEIRAALRLVRDHDEAAWPVLDALEERPSDPLSTVRISDMADDGADFSGLLDEG